MTRIARLRTAATAVFLTLSVLAGCASGSTGSAAPEGGSPGGYAVVTSPTLRPGEAVPAPTGTVVLEVTGDLAQGSAVELDLATIERLGLVEYSVDDKQAEGRRVTFRGVLLQSLLDYLGVADASTLHTVALNDYSVDIPVSDARTYPVLLATSVDGRRMSVEHYGPTRVVYPTDGVALDPVVYDSRWIWQLKTIEVE